MEDVKFIAFRVNANERKLIKQIMLDQNFKSYKEMLLHCVKMLSGTSAQTHV